MKKFLSLLLISTLIFTNGINTVNAQEYYYTNEYGVNFTKEEYDFFSEMYYDGYQKYMTQEDRKIFNGIELKPENVTKNSYIDYTKDAKAISIKGNYHETQAKILTINKAGTINPVISIIAQWKYAPNVRSYDLIGAYFSGVSIASGITSKITYTGGTIYQAADVTASNGFGSVLKLPTNGADIVVSSTFAVSGHGTIYGSYQHAKSSISLNNAKSFTISFSGLGNVHYFSNMNIRAKYDAMQGVDISV